MEKTTIIIPARMGSTRLPGKPLADIGGKPMIVHVMERAQAANLGEVIIACAEQEIKDAVEKAGGRAILTPADLPSGTDRIHYATKHEAQGTRHDIIINLQGDMPLIDPAILSSVLKPLENPAVDIATLVTPMKDAAAKANPNKVKAILTSSCGPHSGSAGSHAEDPVLSLRETQDDTVKRALYFTRAAAPHGNDEFFYHIGIYAYRRAALERFVALPPSPLEKLEKLEQLRALEAGMRIDATIVATEPLGVDTPEDLEKARTALISRPH